MNDLTKSLNEIDLTDMDYTQICEYQMLEITMDMLVHRLQETFVVMGYLLKRARDTNILVGSKYKSVTEFAWDRYRLHKDQVSRYIAINDRFSENGYSPKLQKQFERFGLAKLQEMLLLPDSIIAELSPEMTKAQIQSVKKAVQEENKRTDIEVMLEPLEAEYLSTMSEKAIYKYFQSKIDKYEAVYDIACRVKYGTPAKDALVMTMAPSGLMNEFVRPSGMRQVFITLDAETGVFTFTNSSSGEKEQIDSDEFIKIFNRLFTPTYSKDLKLTWKLVYNEEKYPGDGEPEKQQTKIAERQQASKETERNTGKTEQNTGKLKQCTGKAERYQDKKEQCSKELGEIEEKEIKTEKEEIAPEQKVNADTGAGDETSELPETSETSELSEISDMVVVTNAEKTGSEEQFTEQASHTPTYRDTVFDEMAAVADKLRTSIIEQNTEQIDNTLKDLRRMLDTVMQADENNEIIGQMSLSDMEQ